MDAPGLKEILYPETRLAIRIGLNMAVLAIAYSFFIVAGRCFWVVNRDIVFPAFVGAWRQMKRRTEALFDSFLYLSDKETFKARRNSSRWKKTLDRASADDGYTEWGKRRFGAEQKEKTPAIAP